MKVSTTAVLDGFRVCDYLGPIGADVPIGRAKNGFDAIKQQIGLRSAAQHTSIDVAREKALALLEARAESLGANAVIGLQVSVAGNARGTRYRTRSGSMR